MPLIIDTYNVLHVTGVLPPDLAGIDTAGLIDLLARSRYGGEKATLVCDGIPGAGAPTGRFGPLSVRYAGPNRLADDVIQELINKSSVPRRLLVVSSDREILRAARRRRCRVLTSEQFLGRLARDAAAAERSGRPRRRPAGPLASEDVEHWSSEFDVDVDALERDLPRVEEAEDEVQAKHAPTPPDAGLDEPPPDVPVLPADLVREAERLIEVDDAQNLPPQADEGDRMDR